MTKRNKLILITSILFLSTCIFIGYTILNKQLPFLLKIKHSDYLQRAGSFYNLYYDGSEEDKVNKLVNITDTILITAITWFGEFDKPKEKLKIFLIHKNDQPHSGLKDGYGNYFPEYHLMFINSDLDEDQLINTFSHEFAHYIMGEYLNEHNMESYDIPVWYHEGVAEAFAHQIKTIPFLTDVSGGRIQPLMEFSQSKMTREDYLLSHFAIENIINENDESIITELIRMAKEGNDFTTAFNKLTGYDLDTYHQLFEVDIDQLTDMVSKAETLNESEAEKLILDYIATKGRYFNEAPTLLYALSNIYIRQGRFDEALKTYEEVILYEKSPAIYAQLSEIALKVDRKKALKYATEALELAKEKEWNVEVFNQHLDEVKKLTNES